MERIQSYSEFINEARRVSSPVQSSGILTSISSGIADFFKKAEERFEQLPDVYDKFRLKGPQNPWGTDTMSTGIGRLVGLAGQAVSGTAEKVFRPSDKAKGDLKRTFGVLDLTDEERKITYGSNFERSLRKQAESIPMEKRSRTLEQLETNPPFQNELESETGKIDYVIRTVYEPTNTKPNKNPRVDAYANMAANFYDAYKAGTI